MYKRYIRQLHGNNTGKMKLVIIVVAALLVAGGAGLFFLKGRGGSEAANADAEGGATAVAHTQEPAQIIELGEFLVNLTTANQLRYLKVEVALSMRGEGLEGGGGGHGGGDGPPELPREKMLKAKDITVEQLSAQKFAALRTTEGRQRLKNGLQEALQAALPEYEIEDVLFVSLVMQ